MAEKQVGAIAGGALEARLRNSDVPLEATGRGKTIKQGGDLTTAENQEATSKATVGRGHEERGTGAFVTPATLLVLCIHIHISSLQLCKARCDFL